LKEENNMDFNLIKKLLKKEGGKIIIVEDGNPTMIISAFDECIKEEITAPISQGIAMPAPAKKEILPEAEARIITPANEEGLTIDDLPF
jgi:hypothetical protein